MNVKPLFKLMVEKKASDLFFAPFAPAKIKINGKIMPVNKKYPVAELFDALRIWNSKKNQKITLEYILIDGINASPEQAGILAKRARSIRAKVNLIPYNTVEGLPWVRPNDEDCLRFKKVLTNAGVSATLRLEKGHDINAACGQLRLKKEQGAL